MTLPQRAYTVREVANMYSVAVPTVRSWIKKGALSCMRPAPKCIRIRLSDLENFEAQTWHGQDSTNQTTELLERKTDISKFDG